MFWRYFFHRKSVLEILKQVADVLPLKNFKLHRLPVPTVVGDYFGFSITLEGARKGEGFRFLATIELPKILTWRLFICHEKRKTSFKPIANLKLVTTHLAKFNQNFLLLSSDEEKAKAVFQPYLCGKITALQAADCELDVYGKRAHLELVEQRLNYSVLCELLRVVAECLNVLLVKEG